MSNNSRGGLVGGVILIGLGVIFLFAQFVRIDIWHFLWPLFVIGFGLLFFVGMLAGGKSASGLAMPGSIITMVGLILLAQNTFDRWETWAYAWSLIIVAVGIGLFIMGMLSGEERTRRSGVRVAGIGVVLFLVFGSFFELSFGLLGFDRTSGIFWPLILIAAGLYLLVSRTLFARRDVPASPQPSVPAPLPPHDVETPPIAPAGGPGSSGGAA